MRKILIVMLAMLVVALVASVAMAEVSGMVVNISEEEVVTEVKTIPFVNGVAVLSKDEIVEIGFYTYEAALLKSKDVKIWTSKRVPFEAHCPFDSTKILWFIVDNFENNSAVAIPVEFPLFSRKLGKGPSFKVFIPFNDNVLLEMNTIFQEGYIPDSEYRTWSTEVR